MSTPEVTPAEVSAEADKTKKSPMDALANVPGAPTPQKIEEMKRQTPNGRVRLYTNDMKRFFIVRGLGGQELLRLQSELMTTTPEKMAMEEQIKVVCQCTLWTSITSSGRLDDQTLRMGPAGLPSTLYNLITILSDFVDPREFDSLSAEL